MVKSKLTNTKLTNMNFKNKNVKKQSTKFMGNKNINSKKSNNKFASGMPSVKELAKLNNKQNKNLKKINKIKMQIIGRKSVQKIKQNNNKRNKFKQAIKNYASSDDEGDDDDDEKIAFSKEDDPEIFSVINAMEKDDDVMKDSEPLEKKELDKVDSSVPKPNRGISVFVGNLPVNVKRRKILNLFSKFGKVVSIRFRTSNGQKFFRNKMKAKSPFLTGFVDFETIENAKSSLVLNGEKIGEHTIRVNLQSDAKETSTFDAARTIYVGNLKYSVTDQVLYDTFSCCGKIDYARTLQCEQGCKGVGYVCFSTPASVQLALEMNKELIHKREAIVRRYSIKKLGGTTKSTISKRSTFSTGQLKNNKRFKGPKSQSTSSNATTDKTEKVKKNSPAYRGKKTDTKKKHKRNKGLTGLKLLAKKIAPRHQDDAAPDIK